MAASHLRVRVTSRGRIVIPAHIRRELGIGGGCTLVVRRRGREIVLALDAKERDLESKLEAMRAWVRKSSVDPVAELHERHRRERERSRQ
jgi:AbrB family looped-hinge helix DNA binding protein